MRHFNADLHLHSRFSIGTSPKMDLPHMSEAARIKGVDILGTGDCLYRPWLDELESKLEKVVDLYEYKCVSYIIQAEVETTIWGRVHHFLFFPSFSSAYELHDIIMAVSYTHLRAHET